MNQLCEVTIERLAFGGDGLGHLDGMAVFVPGVLPGETLVARLVERKPRFLRAQPVWITRQSRDRRPLDCDHEFVEGCGGCGFRHATDRQSLFMKTTAAMEAIARLAPSHHWPEPLVHPEYRLDGWRTRAKFHSRDQHLGFFKQGTHELLSIPRCRALHPALLEGLIELQSALDCGPKVAFPATVVVEVSNGHRFASCEGSFTPDQERAMASLVDLGVFLGIRLRQRGHQVLLGESWISETLQLDDRLFQLRRRLGTFVQGNPEANRTIRRRLYTVLQHIRPHCLMELFAGSGNLSLVSARWSKQVVAVEGDGDAVEGLVANAQSHGSIHLQVFRRDLRRPLGNRLLERECDTVLLDPPRIGALSIMKDLLVLQPRFILYLSCSPPHLARDVERLAGSYRVECVEAFDMFPRTPHVELLTILEKKGT